MNPIVKFFHEFFNPHCSHCAAEKLQEMEQRELDREIGLICNSCENLKMQLSAMNQLVNKLTNKEEVVREVPQETQRIVPPSFIPWRIKRQRLETESRLKLQELKSKSVAEKNAAQPDNKVEKHIENLETDLGITGTTNGTE